MTGELTSGLQSDGTALAGHAFGGKEPKIRLNKLASESEKNVQAGVEQLIRGLYQAVRNPRSHERVDDSQKDCDALIVFVDYILRVVGHARAAFSIENIMSRLVDESFVENKRYAELLIAEIPRSKRLDTLIAAFENRDDLNASRHKNFFQGCLNTLDDHEAGQFFEVVSSHLRVSTDERELISVFQILDPSQWRNIAEADRMRSENRVIRNIRAGRYCLKKGRCYEGAMATWSRGFMKEFVLKSEVLNEIQSALTSGSREREEYALRFFFDCLPSLGQGPSPALKRQICQRLNSGDARFANALRCFIFETGAEGWLDPFQKELEKFKPSDPIPLPDELDDEMPF